MTESESYSYVWLERWIMSLEKRILHLGEKQGHLTARLEAMEKRTPGPTSSTSSWLERLFSILPTVRELIIWLIPRGIILWGILEGWWAAGWQALRMILYGH